ncbi:MAG: type II restriction endonuclease [Candidatus Gracilibacteria bacterium]|nr:type II restriction endonuclease [Candidatus Gracilibacteria bacterium]
MHTFQTLTTTFTPTIFTWDFYCDFPKIKNNTFNIKVSLNILNSLLGEKDIEAKFLELVKTYPETRGVLPILLAVREKFSICLNKNTKVIENVSFLFDKNCYLTQEIEEKLITFFNESGLKNVFENKHISNLNDYVFGIETGLDSNARKNRSGTLMENLVLDFIKDFCNNKGYAYKDQATAKWMSENWGVNVESDKSSRRFDFAIFTGEKVYIFETNFYGGGGSKLKSVAGEFNYLYKFLQNQGIQMFWVTDGLGWKTAMKPLEETYNSTDGNIYNLEMLRNGILDELIK